MSLLRYSVPGRPVVLVDQGPNTGRIHATRYGIVGGGPPIVIGSHASGESRYSGKREKRTGAHSPKYRGGVSGNGVDRVRLNPDNGAVEASITEVQT